MAKTWAIIFGVVFVIVGLLGFIGGAGIVGPTGIFQTNALHDWVHFLSGLIFLIVAFASARSSAAVLKVFGIVYLLVAILGFVAPSFMSQLLLGNMADNWLHVVLGIVITWVGFAAGKGSEMPMAA